MRTPARRPTPSGRARKQRAVRLRRFARTVRHVGATAAPHADDGGDASPSASSLALPALRLSAAGSAT